RSFLPSSFRPLADLEIDRDRLTAATQRQGNRLADARRAELTQQRVEAGDRLAIPSLDDVALTEAGLRAWPFCIDAHHHRTHAAFAIEPHRLQAEAEIAARDLAVGFELCRDTRERGRRDYEHAPALTENDHAEHVACGVQRDAAFGVTAEREVKLHPRVDLPAPHRPPGWTRGRDHPQRRDRFSLPPANRDGERAHTQRPALERHSRRLG